MQDVIAGYAANAAELIARYEALSTADLLSPVIDLLPRTGRVLDLGAGTGRDAAWFAANDFQVLAVEPVAGFRDAGARLHPSPRIDWLNDRLPDLTAVRQRGGAFDLVQLSGVWQHLDRDQRKRAMPVIATLLASTGILTVSIRHGPGAPNRPCFEGNAEEAISSAEAAGLRLVRRRHVASVQEGNRRAGVTWTWLAFTLPA